MLNFCRFQRGTQNFEESTKNQPTYQNAISSRNNSPSCQTPLSGMFPYAGWTRCCSLYQNKYTSDETYLAEEF